MTTPPRWLTRLALTLLLVTLGVGTGHAQYGGDPKPRSGIGGIVVGAAGFGVAAGNLAFMAVCDPLYGDEDVFANADQAVRACKIGSAVFVVGGVAAGAIGLSIGIPRRKKYKAWRARQVGLVRELRLQPALGHRAAGLQLLGRF